MEGLHQIIKLRNGKNLSLDKILTKSDSWELKRGKTITTIVSHDGVKKIADAAGILTDVEYDIKVSPSVTNNYEHLIQVRIEDHTGKKTTELGEASRLNLTIGRSNPGNMSQKRAYDRAVFRHLGIIGILSEEELQESNNVNKMNNLTPDEAKEISPLINKIWSSKTKSELNKFRTMMQKQKHKYNSEQLNHLRNQWKKQIGEIENTF